MSGSRVGSGINVGGLTFVDTFQILSKLGTTIGRPLQKNSSFTLHSSDTNIHFSGLFFASGTFILETSIDFENCSIYVFFIWKSMFVYHRQYIVHNLCLFRFFCEHIFLLQKLFFLAFSFSNKKKLYWKKVILRFLKSEICPSLAAIMFPLEIIWNERKNFWAPLVFAWLFHYLIFEWFFAFWTSLELSHYWDTEIHKKTFCLFNKFLAFS